MENKIQKVAEVLYAIFQKLFIYRTTLFLVGASHQRVENLRDRIKKKLEEGEHFAVYYPEELFDELLRARGGYDLLQLENMLAESVHAVIIVLESPGAIAELGAFANHPELSKKLIVIVNTRYRRDKSFIMLGPIKYLKEKNKGLGRIIYHNFKSAQIEKLTEDIGKALRKFKYPAIGSPEISNPIYTLYFILMALHVFDRLSYEDLELMVNAVSTDLDQTRLAIRTALKMLLKDGLVSLEGHGYCLTAKGMRNVKRHLRVYGMLNQVDERNIFDKIRVDVLTWSLRKPIKVKA